jgi:hypothetical protein
VRSLLANWAQGSAPAAASAIEQLVPRAVLAYIRAQRLYGAPSQ